tara:strand:- start:2951 stop:3730 length:780 start_codon:yes stop_codon:yes gene_type:complete
LNLDNELIIVKTDNNKYLAVVDITKEFITNEGKFHFKDITSIPSILKSSTGQKFKIYRPTFKEFILNMKRGPQIIYPKDISQIVIESNISSSSKVLEIGTGSGALTLYLVSLLNEKGSLTTVDISKTNQRRAKKTIERYLSTKEINEEYNLNFINQDLNDFNFSKISNEIDTVITDVPEPWIFFDNNKINTDIVWVSYLPSITQVIKTKECLESNNFENIEVKEVILRDWYLNKKIARPDNKLISHTGFLLSARFIKFD